MHDGEDGGGGDARVWFGPGRFSPGWDQKSVEIQFLLVGGSFFLIYAVFFFINYFCFSFFGWLLLLGVIYGFA